MKKFFLSLAVFVMALCANAQTNQYFWYNGNLLMGNPIAQIDSVTFGNEETDSILIYLPHTIIKNIVVHDTVYITIHDTICPNAVPEGALSGEFSVSPTKKVRFSKGNLQYQASTDTWRFADNQWEYVGETNENISTTYDGWIDLFGWGTGNNPTTISHDNADFPNFVDWGENSILNGGNEANLWRTLNNDEWVYLFNIRENGQNLRSQATVCGIQGYVMLPDDFVFPENFNWTPQTNDWAINIYDNAMWILLERQGAIFLPKAGGRNLDGVTVNNTFGGYWSASNYEEDYANLMCFRDDFAYPDWYFHRYDGLSVRLVQDVE